MTADIIDVVVCPEDLLDIEVTGLAIVGHLAEQTRLCAGYFCSTHPVVVRGITRLAAISSFIRPLQDGHGAIVMRGERETAVLVLTAAMETQRSKRSASEGDEALAAWERAARFAEMANRARDATTTLGRAGLPHTASSERRRRR